MNKKCFLKIILLSPFLLNPIELWARAGGGGGHSGGGGIFSIILTLILLPFILIGTWIINQKIRNKHQAVRSALKVMEEKESQWSEDKLIAMAKVRFHELQAAWSKQDLSFLEKQLFPDIFAEWRAQIESQAAEDKKNVMSGISIHDARIVDLQNFKGDEKDNFTVCFDAYAKDQVVNSRGEILEEKNEDFREFWTFKRDNRKWKLFAVRQARSWRIFVKAPIINEGLG